MALVPALTAVWRLQAASHSSELRLRPDGRFLYVGNRGHDSIAVYAINETPGPAAGQLTLVEIVPSGGKCPRNFNFSPCGTFALVGNQNSNSVVSFACCPDTGRLRQARPSTISPAHACHPHICLRACGPPHRRRSSSPCCLRNAPGRRVALLAESKLAACRVAQACSADLPSPNYVFATPRTL